MKGNRKMLKRMKEKREQLRSKGTSGFTLMELIIVIAILAMLIGMLLPRFANYTDKAMGSAAGVDTKNILTVGTAFNLDNNAVITIADLQAATGLDNTAGAAKTLAAGATANQFTYTYTRGGASVTATIDLQSSHIQYVIAGADGSNYDSGAAGAPPIATNADQANRIAKGLGY